MVVSNTYCIALLFLFVFVLCTLCCQFFWIVHFWLPLQHSLTFIQVYNTKFVFLKLYISDFSRWNHGLDYQSGALAIHVVSLTKSHHHVHNSSALVVYIPSKESTLHVDFMHTDVCALEYQTSSHIFALILRARISELLSDLCHHFCIFMSVLANISTTISRKAFGILILHWSSENDHKAFTKVWRYQRDNQKYLIKEGQTIQ
jgi:hypothetical protein